MDLGGIYLKFYNDTMPIYYTGLNNTNLFCDEEGYPEPVIEKFTIVPFAGIDDLEIGWNYMLLWRNKELFVSGMVDLDESADSDKAPTLLKLPENMTACKQAIAGKEAIVALSSNNEIWQYRIAEKKWKKVFNFIYASDDCTDEEYAVKLFQGGCTVALTNLGRVYNIPTLVDMPKRVKFVDVACGFDHTIMLAEDGDVYSMGMGRYQTTYDSNLGTCFSRGQLGHGDLEDCDNPKIIEALAGLKVVKIAAAGWHSAVITDQGDLYTWGWNTHGELGIAGDDTKVFATPIAVDFKNVDGSSVERNVTRVQCGNVFTICMLDDNSLWGCGSNKYGQLGMSTTTVTDAKTFVKLDTGVDEKSVKEFKCREWASVLITN